MAVIGDKTVTAHRCFRRQNSPDRTFDQSAVNGSLAIANNGMKLPKLSMDQVRLLLERNSTLSDRLISLIIS